MKCKHPYMRDGLGKITKVQKVLSQQARDAATPFGCGTCLHCRINQAREWQHRIILEQMDSSESCFTTLTYNDEHLTTEWKGNHVCAGVLVKKDLTNYLKRLRKKVHPIKFRYFAIGEYGELFRPHYHLALFNLGIIHEQYITDAWKLKNQEIGFTQTGDLNKDSAAYIAGYYVSKLTKRLETKDKQKEFMSSSRQKGGLGYGAIQKMAQKIGDSPYMDSKVIRQIFHGSQGKPLGRYLTKKLGELTGNQYDDIFYDIQEEYFEQNKEGEVYYDNLLSITKQARENQKKRYKIYSAKRRL